MAGIRKKLKAIKKRLRRMVSKTPKRKFYYGFFSKYCRLRPKWVLIESFHGQTVSDSGLVLAQEIARLYPGQYRVFYATEDKKKHQAFVDAAGLQVELVDVTTFRYTRILACAQHIFSNASLPIYFIKRPGQVYMQTWHGTPLKTLGKQMRMGIESMYNVQHNFLQADYLTQPNAFTRDVILRDYNLEPLYTGKVVMAGYPRNKVFMEPEKGTALRRQLGLEDKTVYAYMPTWRGTSNRDVDTSEYAAQVHAMLSVLDKSMTDAPAAGAGGQDCLCLYAHLAGHQQPGCGH
jgi:CDP-glycerol glycerophosphotransferase (TagB/SpsB family)